MLSRILGLLLAVAASVVSGAEGKPDPLVFGFTRGGYAIVDHDGKVIVRKAAGEGSNIGYFEGGALEVVVGGKHGVVDAAGNPILPPAYDDLALMSREFYRYDDDVFARVNAGNSWACVDRAGKTIIAAGPDERAGCPVGGIANVCLQAAGSKKRCGYRDRSGKAVVAMELEEANPFSDGLAAVKKGGLWGFVDASGQIVIEPRYLAVHPFREGAAFVRVPGPDAAARTRLARWRVIGRGGEFLSDAAFESERAGAYARAPFAAKLAGGKWGYVDARGATAIEFRYDSAGSFDPRAGVAEVKLDGRRQLIDRTGKVLGIDVARYSPSGGWAAGNVLTVERKRPAWYKGDGLFGLVKPSGEVVREPDLDMIGHPQGDAAAAWQMQRLGLMPYGMHLGVLRADGSFRRVPELDRTFTSAYRDLADEAAALALTPVNPLLGMFVLDPRTSWYSALYALLLVPLVCCVGWAVAYRLSVRTVGTVDPGYGGAVRDCVIWVLASAVLGIIGAHVVGSSDALAEWLGMANDAEDSTRMVAVVVACLGLAVAPGVVLLSRRLGVQGSAWRRLFAILRAGLMLAGLILLPLFLGALVEEFVKASVPVSLVIGAGIVAMLLVWLPFALRRGEARLFAGSSAAVVASYGAAVGLLYLLQVLSDRI